MSFSFQGQGRPSGPPTNYLRTFLIGGTVTAALLGGTWMTMLWSTKRAQKAGTNPYYEQVMLKHGSRKRPNVDQLDLKPMVHTAGHYSDQPPAHHEPHNHQSHMTIDQANREFGDTAAIRRMVPPPQRGRNDGSNRAYTKSPDFVDNYGKTAHARAMQDRAAQAPAAV